MTKKEVELPFVSKHLIIAAFLASYNPASSDYRIFAKRQMKKTRRKGKTNSKTAKEKIPQYLLGPKPFGLERLLAIMFRYFIYCNAGGDKYLMIILFG